MSVQWGPEYTDVIDLLNRLDLLSAWRKKELSQAHFLAENSKNDDARRYLCRVWVLMMYAHCDNFLKEATRAYLEYVKSNLTTSSRYKRELMWLVIRGEDSVGSASNPLKPREEFLNLQKYAQ
jgi:hypothetical protein